MDCLSSYTAAIDTYGLTETMMTDAGVRIQDLEEIGDCVLTPGEPSPVGRTEDGDLAYVINPKRTFVAMTAAQAADLAAMLAKPLDLTDVSDLDFKDETHKLIASLVWEALPQVMFTDSAHNELAYTHARASILRDGAKALPDFLK